MQNYVSEAHPRALRTLYLTAWVSFHRRMGGFPKSNAMLDQLQTRWSKDISHSLGEKYLRQVTGDRYQFQINDFLTPV